MTFVTLGEPPSPDWHAIRGIGADRKCRNASAVTCFVRPETALPGTRVPWFVTHAEQIFVAGRPPLTTDAPQVGWPA